MPDKIIINTDNEENALIPDKWVVGTGLSTNSLYVTHTDAPLMIIQYPLNSSKAPCTIYMKGKIKPKLFNQLFAEAWKLIEIYKNRFTHPKIDEDGFLKDMT